MDLYRVVTATGDISKPAAEESAKQFLTHALSDFDKFENTQHDIEIKKNLAELAEKIFKLKDQTHRLRWTEHILTARCRMF